MYLIPPKSCRVIDTRTYFLPSEQPLANPSNSSNHSIVLTSCAVTNELHEFRCPVEHIFDTTALSPKLLDKETVLSHYSKQLSQAKSQANRSPSYKALPYFIFITNILIRRYLVFTLSEKGLN